eukprot:6172719-Pleurochrysis_carterae.AAC.5
MTYNDVVGGADAVRRCASRRANRGAETARPTAATTGSTPRRSKLPRWSRFAAPGRGSRRLLATEG